MLECRQINKYFSRTAYTSAKATANATASINGGTVHAVNNVNLALPAHSFSVLVGPSGCGKTTLLRLLSGLEQPSSGQIIDTCDSAPSAVQSGQVGYVFQEPRLMPWLDVAKNIGFALQGRISADAIAQRVNSVLDMMGLSDFAHARPDQLSGGMASRVGLARALLSQPRLLLLDEPFAALDALTRKRLQGELVQLWQTLQPTVVFVTHDIEEAVLLGQHIYRMAAGRIVACYTQNACYPRSPTHAANVALRQQILDDFQAEASTSLAPPEP